MVVNVCQMCAPRSSMARTCDLHETNTSLTHFYLNNNQISDVGGCALAAALRATLVLLLALFLQCVLIVNDMVLLSCCARDGVWRGATVDAAVLQQMAYENNKT